MKRLLTATLVLVSMMLPVINAQADEIIDEINEAIKLYKSGDLSGAVDGLDFAAQQIRQLQAGSITKALPEPLKGWKADEAEGSALAGGMMGGAVSASRRYYKGNANIEVSITGESPALQAMMMMFDNSMMLSMSGKKIKKIKGNKAVIEFDKADKYGEITMVIKKAVMVVINGSACALEEMMAYAEALDFEMLEEFAEGQ